MGASRHAFDASRFAASAQNTNEQAVRGVALVVSAAEDVLLGLQLERLGRVCTWSAW
jgi:hypothetical protein